MLRITYDGKELDVDGSQDMFMSYASTDLSNLSVREGGFNNTWQLPNTANNRGVFGNIQEPTGSLDAAYVFKPVMIYNDGTVVFIGLGRVTDIRLNSIGLLVVDALGGLGQDLDNIQASQVVLGENRAGSITNVDGALLAWPIQASGYTAGFRIDGITVPNVVWPWANLRALAHLIFNQIGYSVDDEAATGLELTTYIGGLYRSESEAALELRGQARAVGQTFVGASTVIGTDYLVDTDDVVVSDAFSNGAYNPIGRPIVNIKATLEVDFTAPPIANSITLAVIVRDAARIIGYKQLQLFSIGTAVVYKLEFDIDCELASAFDNDIKLYYRVLNQSTPAYTVNILPTSQWSVEPLDILGFNITLRSIADVTPKDVVTEYLNRFQKLMYVNEFTKVVTLRNLNRLEVLGNAVDWTAKMCRPNELVLNGPYETTFTYGDLAKRNEYTHVNGIGNGVIATETTTGEVERTAYESPFNVFNDLEGVVLNALAANVSSPTWTAKVVNDEVVIWRYWDTTISYAVGEIVQSGFVRDLYRCVNANTGSPPEPNSSDWVRIKYSDVWENRDGVSQIATVLTWNIPRILNFTGGLISYEFGADVNTETKYQQVQFATQFWQPLLDTLAAPLVTALARPRVDKYYIDLDVADIANLDFSRPVLVNGAYYYVVLIDQFDIVYNRPTPVVMLRLA